MHISIFYPLEELKTGEITSASLKWGENESEFNKLQTLVKRIVWRGRCGRTPRRKLPWRSGYLHDSPGRDRKGRNTAWLVKGLQSKTATISSRSKQNQSSENTEMDTSATQKNHRKETMVLIPCQYRAWCSTVVCTQLLFSVSLSRVHTYASCMEHPARC